MKNIYSKHVEGRQIRELFIQCESSYRVTVWIRNYTTRDKIYLEEHIWRHLWRPGLRNGDEDFHV